TLTTDKSHTGIEEVGNDDACGAGRPVVGDGQSIIHRLADRNLVWRGYRGDAQIGGGDARAREIQGDTPAVRNDAAVLPAVIDDEELPETVGIGCRRREQANTRRGVGGRWRGPEIDGRTVIRRLIDAGENLVGVTQETAHVIFEG